MSSEKVVVLAVTKMLSGMCTGGVRLSDGRWVRPVKQFGTLLLGDLTYRDRTVMQPFDVVDFQMVKPKPSPPHIEDWVCDFVRARPERVDSLEDPLQFLQAHSHKEDAESVLRARKSLGLFEPSDILATFRMDSYSGKYEARLQMPETGERPLPVTDIRWRALGRTLLAGRQELALPMAELRSRLGFERTFVALGLGRMHEGRHWPLVIGVHACPGYRAQVDYRDP